MTAWELPTSLSIRGTSYKIRTDYRVILDILTAVSDPNLLEPDATKEERDWAQSMVILEILYEDFDSMPEIDWQEALQKANEFIDCGITDDGRKQPRVMDWEQDAPIMIPALNSVVGRDIRGVDYMHWWTFFGSYMEINENSLFSQVINIRQKKTKHKKLEKWERDFYNANKNIIDFHKKVSEEQQKEIESLKKWL